MRRYLDRLRGALTAALCVGGTLLGNGAAASPYPPSSTLSGLTLDWSTFRRDAEGSDNWATTWAGNGKLYTTWGDGGGFGPDAARTAYVSVGIAELTGNGAQTLAGRNLIGGLSPSVAPCFKRVVGLKDNRKPYRGHTFPCRGVAQHGKMFSLLALGTNLYGFMTPGSSSQGYAEARVYRAPLGTNGWTAAKWAFKRTDPYPMIYPAYVQAGQNYGDIGDYLYVYATRYAPSPLASKLTIQKGPQGGEIGLMRLPRNADPMNQKNWQYFSGTAEAPAWSSANAAARSVVIDPAGIGFAVSAFYIKPLNRFLLFYLNTAQSSGNLTVLESVNPWGPWQEVWSGTIVSNALNVPANAFYFTMLPNSVSSDGRRFTLIFTGIGVNDSLNAVDARFGGN